MSIHRSVLRCPRSICGQIYGPAVGAIITVSVGPQTYVLNDVLAIRCDLCGHVHGHIPALIGEPLDVRCPDCGRKSGEMHVAGVLHIAAAGREVWASSVMRIACRCGCDWEPAQYSAPNDAVGAVRR